jgi:signal transduction histidine kinase
VAALGQRALEEPDLGALMGEAVATLAETLDVELTAVLELLPGEPPRLRKLAHRGWPEARVLSLIPGDVAGGLPVGHLLASDGPLIVRDLAEDERFAGANVLHALGVRSGLSVEIHLPDRVFGVISGYARTLRNFTSDDVNFVQAIANVLSAAVQRQLAQEALDESEQRRRQVLGAMLRAEEEERARIAADLHDDTVQVITATLLSLDRVSSAIDQGRLDRIASAAAASRRTLSTAVERTRRLMFELRPPLLEANGLADAVRDLVGAAAEEGELEVEVVTRVGRHAQPLEALAYRTIREAISNVRKHAHARHLRVLVCERDGALEGLVEDDGRGFDLERALDRGAVRMHLGLGFMIERVHLAGGELDVDTAPGRATRVSFRLPLEVGGD